MGGSSSRVAPLDHGRDLHSSMHISQGTLRRMANGNLILEASANDAPGAKPRALIVGVGGRLHSGVSIAEVEKANEGQVLVENVVGVIGLQNSESGAFALLLGCSLLTRALCQGVTFMWQPRLAVWACQEG